MCLSLHKFLWEDENLKNGPEEMAFSLFISLLTCYVEKWLGIHFPVTASLWPSLSAEAILSWDDSGMHCRVKGLSSLEGRREVKYWEMSWGGHFFSGFGWRGEEGYLRM